MNVRKIIEYKYLVMLSLIKNKGRKLKKTVWLNIGIIIGAIIYLIGFMMINHELWNPLSQAYDSLPEATRTKFWGEFLFQTSSLLLTIFVLKFLLGMEPFKDAIKDIFSEIFSEQKFLEGFDKESLRKIAKNIHLANRDIDFIDKHKNKEFIDKTEHYFRNFDKDELSKIAKNIHLANNDIEFIDKTKDNESVVKLEKYFNTDEMANNNKNYLVLESNYSTTLYASGIEIMHRRIKCKIIKEGKFEFEYLFTAPDNSNSLDFTTYENTSENDRFKEVSYNSILKSSIRDDGFQLKDQLSNGKIDEDDAVSILFSKIHTEVNEVLDIEFSISHPFKLTDEKDIEDYYNSTYSNPHAIRNITFQVEKYHNKDQVENIPDISPILYSAPNKLIKGNYKESIYYKTYYWEIYYSQDECEKVSIKIK